MISARTIAALMIGPSFRCCIEYVAITGVSTALLAERPLGKLCAGG